MIRFLTTLLPTTFKDLLGGCVFGVLGYFSPIKDVVISLFILMSIDWVSGVYRSYRNRGDIKGFQWFTSKRCRESIDKGASYMVVIIAVFVLENKIINLDWNLVQATAMYIGFVEVKSIYENWSQIRGNDFLHDLITYITDKVKMKLNEGKQ